MRRDRARASDATRRHATPLLRDQHASAGRSSIDVQRCPDAAEGCGDTGVAVCPESRSVCRGGDDVATQCSGGLTGPFCELCERSGQVHLLRVGGNGTSADECVDCAEYGLVGRVAGYAALFACVVAGVIVLLALARRFMSRALLSRLSRLWHASKPHNKLKICLGYCAREAHPEPLTSNLARCAQQQRPAPSASRQVS